MLTENLDHPALAEHDHFGGNVSAHAFPTPPNQSKYMFSGSHSSLPADVDQNSSPSMSEIPTHIGCAVTSAWQLYVPPGSDRSLTPQNPIRR